MLIEPEYINLYNSLEALSECASDKTIYVGKVGSECASDKTGFLDKEGHLSEGMTFVLKKGSKVGKIYALRKRTKDMSRARALTEETSSSDPTKFLRRGSSEDGSTIIENELMGKVDALLIRLESLEIHCIIAEKRCTKAENRCTVAEEKTSSIERGNAEMEAHSLSVDKRCSVTEGRFTKIGARCLDAELRCSVLEKRCERAETRCDLVEDTIQAILEKFATPLTINPRGSTPSSSPGLSTLLNYSM